MVAVLVALLCSLSLADSSSMVPGFKEKEFESFTDFYLEGHIAQTHQVSTPLDCAFECLSDSRCQSYNYQKDGTPTHACDINSENKTGQPLPLVNKPGFIYFHPVEQKQHLSSPVQAPLPTNMPTTMAIFDIIASNAANFTNLGASGRSGPSSIGDHYKGQGHDGHVTLMEGIQHWTIPCTGLFTIEAVGASGGYDSSSTPGVRGYGARMIGTFLLIEGEILKILVGQEGGINTSPSSGGGGGSFVVRSDDTPLIIAGGGGGEEGLTLLKTECHATTSTSGNSGYSGSEWPGGSDGNGANTADDDNSGGGGGGLLTSGRSSTDWNGSYGRGGEGGQGFLQGGLGGRSLYNNAQGGFGGGGGAYGSGGGAGGGGGYSGGASGDNIGDSCGGGGGSYNNGDEQNNVCCYNDKGHGFVFVTWIC